MKRVCVHWPRFGSYHTARLRAAHAHFRARGIDFVALETAGIDRSYAWSSDTVSDAFERVRVFPDRIFEEIPPREMVSGVQAALDRLDPDAVAITSYSYPDARASLQWCRRHRRVAVLMTDSKEDDMPRTRWRELIKRLLVAQYDAALVGGKPHRRYLEKLGFPPDRIFDGVDVVDNHFFATAAAHVRQSPETVRHLPGLREGTPFFLAVSRYIPLKNLDRLIDAYARYRATAAHPWGLCLVGDGPERPALETQLRAHGVEGVTLCGLQEREQLAAYYALAGAFVHPTLKDTWGLVVNEAMAAGLPVLVSDRAGCAEDLVEGGRNGFTFDPERPSQLAELMTQIAASETRASAFGARSEELIRRFSPDYFARQLHHAIRAGEPYANRGLHPIASGLLIALRLLASRPDSFQGMPDDRLVLTQP